MSKDFLFTGLFGLEVEPKTEEQEMKEEKMELQIFNNENFGTVRTILKGEEPLFCLSDVCKILDLIPSKAAQRLSEGVLSKYPLETAGGVQQANFVNEDGLYDVILDSRKPEARKFRKWITSEVLPSIRKNGGYLSPTVDFSDFDTMQKLFTAWRSDREKLVAAEARTNRLIHNNTTYSTTEIAKELGFRSAQELNQKLSEMGVQYKDRRGVWLLNAEYSKKGFQNLKQKELEGKTEPLYYSEWTGLGRDWLLGLFYKKVV